MVWRIERFDEVDSTNTYLSQLVERDTPEGLVAVARFQRAGRGRRDRQWVAPPDSSLLCSILLRPPLESDQLVLAVAAVALSARGALVRLCGLLAGLKWPNDLVVGESKLAGLLAEVVVGRGSPAIVVGIGVNLTARGPEGLATACVRDETGVTLAPEAVLDMLLEELDARRALLDSDEGRRALRREYESALVTIGQEVRVELTGEDAVTGVATGLDDLGRLRVLQGGIERVFDVGDVVHLRARRSDVP